MLPPFRSILSPVDFDDSSVSALAYAAHFARQDKAMVYLLHVVPPAEKRHLYRDLYSTREGEGFDPAHLETVAADKLHDIARVHLSDEIRYETLIRVGDAATSILETAQAVAAELIVMATHGRKGMARVFLGSVAERVVREARCPVLTVRGS